MCIFDDGSQCEEWSFFNSFYMTIITIGTVGFHEVAEMSQDGRVFTVGLIIFGIGIIGTVLYLLRVAKVNDWSQITVSTIAFVVWVFALGGPFSHCAWYQPAYGALILPIYTFFVPIMISR